MFVIIAQTYLYHIDHHGEGPNIHVWDLNSVDIEDRSVVDLNQYKRIIEWKNRKNIKNCQTVVTCDCPFSITSRLEDELNELQREGNIVKRESNENENDSNNNQLIGNDNSNDNNNDSNNNNSNENRGNENSNNNMRRFIEDSDDDEDGEDESAVVSRSRELRHFEEEIRNDYPCRDDGHKSFLVFDIGKGGEFDEIGADNGKVRFRAHAIAKHNYMLHRRKFYYHLYVNIWSVLFFFSVFVLYICIIMITIN